MQQRGIIVGTPLKARALPSGKGTVEVSAAVSLDAKGKPHQSRSRETYEMILAAAGDLLAEIGFERLSTNMVCQRAGLTPPALYRYFPNKYAILAELANRLMLIQDDVALRWLEQDGVFKVTQDEMISIYADIQRQVNEVTRAQPGGIWIMRALRAVPLLQEVRVASQARVSRKLFEALIAQFPGVPQERLNIATRLTTELSYAATEMVLQEPGHDEAAINEEVARMVASYFARFLA
jgi:AcrR family transcriptional regulator